jgi:uncharacterized protein (UPF0303 family)
VDGIRALEESLTLPHFTADDAWKLGASIREALLHAYSPAVINITLANSNQLLFHTMTRSGTIPDNDLWVARKRATVLRWGCSSWLMNIKMESNEQLFREKFLLGDRAGTYAIHGGGVPIRVKGVEGVVAVAVVSGLKQEDDHMAVVEALQRLQKEMSA